MRPRPRVPARPPSPESLALRREPNAEPRTSPLGSDRSVATGQEAERSPGRPRCGAPAAERHRGPTASLAAAQAVPCRSSPAAPRPALPSAGHALNTPPAWDLPLWRPCRVALSLSIKDVLPGGAGGRRSVLPIKSAPVGWGPARPSPYVTVPQDKLSIKEASIPGEAGGNNQALGRHWAWYVPVTMETRPEVYAAATGAILCQ